MSITMLEYEVMGKGYSRKRIPGKGKKIFRACLGTCGKKFRTTVETRICPACKRYNEGKQEDDVYFIHYRRNL